jgi:hypothetical protein
MVPLWDGCFVERYPPWSLSHCGMVSLLNMLICGWFIWGTFSFVECIPVLEWCLL